MTGPGDLSTLFAQSPAQGSQDMRYRQGTILSFDQNTLANTVQVGNQVFTNLPVLGVGEATLLVPGSIVGLLVIGQSSDPNSDAKTYAIVGRLVIPNTADATNAITLLNSSVYSASVPGTDSTTSAAPPFVDLATVGPIVSGVNVGVSGRVLVLSTCQFNFGATNGTAGGEMSFAVDGPTSSAAGGGRGPMSHLQATGVGVTTTVIDAKSRAKLLSGLAPGDYTFTAKYASTVGGVTCNFSDRNITVFAL